MALFHPRPETGAVGSAGTGLDLLIPVEEDIRVGARFHIRDNTCPNILFFHGNGEIVSDYDDLGPMYNQLEINFLPVDYRGYGRSNGEPSRCRHDEGLSHHFQPLFVNGCRKTDTMAR